MNVNEKINVRSYYKSTIERMRITAINPYELIGLKLYKFHSQPYFKTI
jgi:hypothetical protein